MLEYWFYLKLQRQKQTTDVKMEPLICLPEILLNWQFIFACREGQHRISTTLHMTLQIFSESKLLAP